MSAHPTTTATTWRHAITGAPAYLSDLRPETLDVMDPKSNTVAIFARPTRRGAPPH